MAGLDGKTVASFMGKAAGTVDIKGRVSLPSKYRKLLPEELVLAKSPNKEFPSLIVYTLEGFNAWLDGVMESKGGYKQTSQELDDINEEYSEDAEIVKIDSIGRINIPQDLREYAGIQKEVVISGARTHLVLRSQEVWEANRQRREKTAVYEQPSL
jgi:MraZ protein